MKKQTTSVKPKTIESCILLETEHFENLGGWTLDTEFIHSMGSPYLMAHGLGCPVEDATTSIDFPEKGQWRIWVRTLDWVAQWNAPGTPGKFQVCIDGQPIDTIFGVQGADWNWQDGGVVEITQSKVTVSLHDLTGFNGRCDAIFFTRDLEANPPPNDNDSIQLWRQELLGTESTESNKKFDLVVVGGGYAGMCTALSAARSGLSVALVQDRPVLGGNASSEIRVNLRGLIPESGPYPHLGEIVKELQYDALPDAREADRKDDDTYTQFLGAEPNLTLLLDHCAIAVKMDGNQICAVRVRPTRQAGDQWLSGRCFADCTGHGNLGAMAAADFAMAEADIMGMTNLWSWDIAQTEQSFPEILWALELDIDDFPLPSAGKVGSTWRWESGFNLHPINDLEAIRDWNLRAIFGAWQAFKQNGKTDDSQNAYLSFVSALGGPRESRRLLGDHVLCEDDMLNHIVFDDGFVPITWYLDRHCAHSDYNQKYPDNPFIATGMDMPEGWGDVRPRHAKPWWGIPYRCLYSRNISNLFMAGRNISTNYWSLGAVRVMRTCGMMGEVVGKAAYLCKKHNTFPRGIYSDYLDELKSLVKE